MCENLTILIENDEAHYVSQCVHGTVHVVWGHLSLALGLNDFMSLVDGAVGACLQGGAPPDGRAAAFRLYVEDVLLCLEAETFWQFTDLMRRAAEEMTPVARFKVSEGTTWDIEIVSRTYAPPANAALN